MKRLVTLIIIVSVFFMGCATTGDITEPQNEVIVEAEQAGYQMSSQNPELPWYMNPEIVEFNVNDNLVYFTNSETGEEFPLIEYEYMQEALTNEGFKMNITFTELSETVWMMEYMIHFAEKRDNQFGGATGRNAELNGESASFYFEYLNTRYPVEKFIFQSTA